LSNEERTCAGVAELTNELAHEKATLAFDFGLALIANLTDCRMVEAGHPKSGRRGWNDPRTISPIC